MAKVTHYDIAVCALEIGPATDDEIAAHLGSTIDGVVLAFREAVRNGLIERYGPDRQRGITTWIASAEGRRALQER